MASVPSFHEIHEGTEGIVEGGQPLFEFAGDVEGRRRADEEAMGGGGRHGDGGGANRMLVAQAEDLVRDGGNEGIVRLVLGAEHGNADNWIAS